MVAQTAEETPITQSTPPTGPRGVFEEGAVKVGEVVIPREKCDHWVIQKAHVVITPEKVRIDGVRCIDRETLKTIEETWIVRYTDVKIKWTEKWTRNHGIGHVTLEWANARLTLLLEDAEITILD